MDKIRELLSRLSELSADELTELRSLIVAEADRLDNEETTVENVAALNKVLEMGDQVMAEASAREAAQAEAEATKAEARTKIAALKGEQPEEETEETSEAPAAESTEETPEAEAESTEEAETPAEAVTASTKPGSSVRRMAAAAAKPKPSPESQPERSRTVLTASGALRGVDHGKPIEDRDQLATAMAETLGRMPRQGAPRGDVLLASARYAYPEERVLGSDAWENSRKMGAVTDPQALVASGGICLPVNVDYTVPTWATADRPLRDALPSFEATRGGLRYVQPPDIGALAGATGIWSEATDASPGASTKPVISIACGTEELVYVEAVSTRLGFGNMQSRFAPEQIAANTDLAVAAAARIAENNLLNLIAAACVSGVTQGTGGGVGLGATRDLLTGIYQAVAAYRNAHRIPRSQTITAIFPDWLNELVKIDMAREIGHQQDSSWNSLMISDAQVRELLSNAGLNPIFHLDGQPSSVSGGVAQTFAVQSGSTSIESFPSKMVWYLFPEGQIQFLDGGRLDLGVVRDSTLDATNDYETFVETFEGVAFRGFASGAIQYVSTLCANGTSAGTVDMHATCA